MTEHPNHLFLFLGVCDALIKTRLRSLHCPFSRMQRASRLKRELQMLSTEPPPGITCWQTDERIDDLRARKYCVETAFVLSSMPRIWQAKYLFYLPEHVFFSSSGFYRDSGRNRDSIWRWTLLFGDQGPREVHFSKGLTLMEVFSLPFPTYKYWGLVGLTCCFLLIGTHLSLPK